MENEHNQSSLKTKMKCKTQEQSESEDETWNSDDDDETIARIQRAHYAQAAAMSQRRRSAPRPKPMSFKRKMEAVKNFHDFTKKLKKDTGITIRSLKGNNILNEFSSSDSDDKSDTSDGLSEQEFEVNPNAISELNEENESYIDPVTGDFVEVKKNKVESVKPSELENDPPSEPQPKTLTISDIINDGDLDLTKNVEIAELEEGELCSEKTAEELLGMKQEDITQEFDITEKLKEMGEISVKPIKKDPESESEHMEEEKKSENDEEKKAPNPNALNVRRNIREVMDEKQLDASTLAAQRQESERLARVQEQQRLIREVQRQLAQNRQNKANSQRIALLPGGSSILKKAVPGQKLNLPNTVLVKLPSGEIKRTTLKHGQVEVTRIPKPVVAGPSVGQKILKPELKTDKKEVVEIVDSSSGEESSSSSSDSDDCIMLSDSEVPPSPEADEDPNNSGLHVNDVYNVPDEQGRVLINIGHAENEEDIFLAPQIARVIKPHQIGGVRFLFDNIIESVERFSTSTGFGCILAHSMGLGKTLQIVCFCDIFLRHTKSKTVLCIMPINTLQNWVAEFNMWLPLDGTNSPLAAHGEVRPRNFPIYVLNDSHKTLQMRAKVVKEWATTGGVLMIGYELYRLLSMKKDKKPRKKKKADAKQDKEKIDDKKADKDGNDDTQGSVDNMKGVDDKEDKEEYEKLDPDSRSDIKKDDEPTDEEKKLLDEMYEALVRPGPDLVICDEGHRIKNSHSNISYALKQMRTKRRVVLTGYPLQNNLLEYWCMVDFVRPNYLGSKTEFCNMFERPIQNGQCIDSTPQDIRLMRYRAHVLHSLLVGFVQRRSHAVLQSTLPQKEEYVLLIRMTPLQRKLYDRFMNEVVRSTSVPNPLKAFAICCKIWNHPDVLYNYLRKRSEANAIIEEDLDLEEIGGMTKAGRASRSKTQLKKPAKPRVSNKKGASKKPAATISPNTTSIPPKPNSFDSSPGYGNQQFPSNGPYGSQHPPYRSDQPTSYPSYPGYSNPNTGFYPQNQVYNHNYGANYYPQQQPPYSGNYPNQYPQNNPESSQNYNQNYWSGENYYGNPPYYNNQPYQNNQSQDFRGNTPNEYSSSTPYSQQYNSNASSQSFTGNIAQQFPNNQDTYANQQRPYAQPPYQNPSGYPQYNPNTGPGPGYQNNQPGQNYPNQNYSNSYVGETYGIYNSQYDSSSPNYPNYPNNPNNAPPENSTATNNTQPEIPNNVPEYPSTAKNVSETSSATQSPHYTNPYSFGQGTSLDQTDPTKNPSSEQFRSYQSQIEVKPNLEAVDGQINPWPIADVLKSERKPELEKLDTKTEVKSESDSEFKIEDLDTKKIISDDSKCIKKEITVSKDVKEEKFVQNNMIEKNDTPKEVSKEVPKSEESESDDCVSKNKKEKKISKGKEPKKTDKRNSKTKTKLNAKSRKDRKTSKDRNDDSDSEGESEKEKLSREEELAMVKKAEEMTYDWATELLKDYIPGIIENSAKMQLFFFILNESIRLGDRLLLFSQSLFTLNLIEDFLEKNYIPGTNCFWERNTNYYRLDGSTHALEREKLINEFNANPHIYLFLVSTRAGSLGINLVGANRVIVFDSSWNPCHDTQAVCRVYRYGQKKPCFVYRFVMDWCLEKKIYDRQINKQGMADRVVDECNPDAVLSMKEITNLCFDTDEKETEAKDLSEYRDKYIDVVMQKIITDYGKLLSKEPFQHESLLVDRKEKKLSSAEKRLAQRGYELEKKAASAPKPTTAYRTVRTADGSIVQRPVASVRPMQHGARWIPADVWRRQGMTAQEMTLPLDVVIPTNSAEKTNIVLKAGQRVMVLKSPKGIYMQLESGKIIAIKTSFKMGQKPTDIKENPTGKKVIGGRPSPQNLPGSLKNNSAITVKPGPRPGLQRVITRPILGHNKVTRPFIPGQKLPPRVSGADPKSYSLIKSKAPLPSGRLIRPNLSGSVSITKISKEVKKPETELEKPNSSNTLIEESDDDPQVLDSEEDEVNITDNSESTIEVEKQNVKEDVNVKDSTTDDRSEASSSSNNAEKNECNASKTENESPPHEKDDQVLMNLTTDEKLPSEAALEEKCEKLSNNDKLYQDEDKVMLEESKKMDYNDKSSKMSLLKNYRHQRPGTRVQGETCLSILEKAATAIRNKSMPDFRKNLDDITQASPSGGDDRSASKSKKKKSPQKPEENAKDKTLSQNPIMSHSVSNLLGSSQKTVHNLAPVAPMGQSSPTPSVSQSRYMGQSSTYTSHSSVSPVSSVSHLNTVGQTSNGSSFKGISGVNPNPSLGMMGPGHATPVDSTVLGASISKTQPSLSSIPPGGISPSHPIGSMPLPGHPGYPVHNSSMPESAYGQYPGYGMGYAGYPGAPYYGGYGGSGYYPPYPAPPSHSHVYSQPAPPAAAAPVPLTAPATATSEHYPPANPQW